MTQRFQQKQRPKAQHGDDFFPAESSNKHEAKALPPSQRLVVATMATVQNRDNPPKNSCLLDAYAAKYGKHRIFYRF